MEESPKYLLAKVAAAALTKVGAQEKGAGKVEITALDRPLLAPPPLLHQHLALLALVQFRATIASGLPACPALLKMLMPAAAPNMHMRQ